MNGDMYELVAIAMRYFFAALMALIYTNDIFTGFVFDNPPSRLTPCHLLFKGGFDKAIYIAIIEGFSSF